MLFIRGSHFLLLPGAAAVQWAGPLVGEALAVGALAVGAGPPSPTLVPPSPTLVSEGPNVNTGEDLCKQTVSKGVNVNTSSCFNEGDGFILFEGYFITMQKAAR